MSSAVWTTTIQLVNNRTAIKTGHWIEDDDTDGKQLKVCGLYRGKRTTRELWRGIRPQCTTVCYSLISARKWRPNKGCSAALSGRGGCGREPNRRKDNNRESFRGRGRTESGEGSLLVHVLGWQENEINRKYILTWMELGMAYHTNHSILR